MVHKNILSAIVWTKLLSQMNGELVVSPLFLSTKSIFGGKL